MSSIKAANNQTLDYLCSSSMSEKSSIATVAAAAAATAAAAASAALPIQHYEP